MTINEIKKALDDLAEEKEDLEDKIYKLEEKMKKVAGIIRQYTYSTHEYINDKEIRLETKTVIPEEAYLDLLNILEK